MAWNPLAISGAVVLDANAAISISAKEATTQANAKATLLRYTNAGYLFYAPGVIVSETLYALCKQEGNSLVTLAEYALAVSDFDALMGRIQPPPSGDASLVHRASQICDGYGASRSADAIYIALAEELSQTYTTRLMTFDRDLPKQAARNASAVTVHLLT